ncbi:MAG: ATP-binding protein [Myxococcota bacterium]
MDERELRAVIEQAREGGGEETDLEFKRQWWAFGLAQPLHEFRRDVAAMANAHVRRPGPRHVVIGLKGGQLFDAPLPVDEAVLQGILADSVTPVPRVHVVQHVVDGIVIAVVVLEPPFERPYVVRRADGSHEIPIRRGSRIGTVSRGDLDLIYQFGRGRPSIVLDWLLEADDDTLSGVRLTAASVATRDRLLEQLGSDEATLRLVLSSTEVVAEVREAVEQFSRVCTSFREEVSSEHQFQEWYHARYGDAVERRVRLVLSNEGVAPATSVRLTLAPPPWLRISADPYVASDTWGYPPDIPRVPDLGEIQSRGTRPAQLFTRSLGDEHAASIVADFQALFASSVLPTELASAYAAIRTSTDEILAAREWDAAVGPPLMFHAPSVRREHGLTVQDGIVTWELDEVLQDHEVRAPVVIYVTAMPGAPLGEQTVEARLFHRELERHQSVGLPIAVSMVRDNAV